MMQVRYRAIDRELNTVDSPAHVAGTDYTLTVSLKSLGRKRKVIKKTAKSLSGVEQTTYLNAEVTRNCKTVPVTGSDILNLREFLSSVEAGELFEFNDGSGFVDCYIDSNGYNESRTVMLGSGGSNDYMTFGWTHREA